MLKIGGNLDTILQKRRGSNSMKIFFSPSCLYPSPNHPENPERVKTIVEFLKEKGFSFSLPNLLPESMLYDAHTREHVEKVKKGLFIDFETPNLPNIFYHALLSASSSVKAAKKCDTGFCFSLMRPPGHHAGKNFLGGFCYFNNIAIAVSQVLEQYSKIVIIDFDAHHGNGTEDIFFGNEKVFYFSIHQFPGYPGTGKESRKNIFNFPIPPGRKREHYIKTFKSLIEKVRRIKPDLIAISAGFDVHRDDPLTHMSLLEEDFALIGKEIVNLETPMFGVLEGGYGPKLSYSVYNFISSFY